MPWAPNYIEPSDLTAWIADVADDAQVLPVIAAASRACDQAAGRQFGQVDTPEARFYDAELFRGQWSIPIDDVQDDDVTVEIFDGSVYVELTAFTLGPRNAGPTGRPWTRVEVDPGSAVPNSRPVRVTGLWGWTEVPEPIRQACLLQAARLLSRRHSPMGIAGNLDIGEMRLLERLDVDLTTSVAAYRRRWGAV